MAMIDLTASLSKLLKVQEPPLTKCSKKRVDKKFTVLNVVSFVRMIDEKSDKKNISVNVKKNKNEIK